ncbi:hypothetical protein JGY85_00505 [Shigella sonnei]|nr:hypothetical protein [Shigella sonnei]
MRQYSTTAPTTVTNRNLRILMVERIENGPNRLTIATPNPAQTETIGKVKRRVIPAQSTPARNNAFLCTRYGMKRHMLP